MWHIVWLLSAMPILDLFYLALNNDLGPNPQETLLRSLGIWSLVFLLLTYSVSVLSSWGIKNLIGCRRMLGLWAFFYLSIHFFAFFAFEHSFVLSSLVVDFISRPFVTFGVIAFILMIPLALTSNNFSVRLLKKAWKKLHFLINPIMILTLIHFFLHRAGKNDFLDPFIALGVFLLCFFVKYSKLLLKIKYLTKKLSS